MGFKCGIIGLPNVGKSTIFNALTAAGAEVANYPFCTINPNIGIVPVPDKRLEMITKIIKPGKVLYSNIEFHDIAGLVQGASRGEGLGNKFLSHIREVDAIVHIVRCFENPSVSHVNGSIDPIRDIETVNTELILADLETLEKKISKTEKLTKLGDKHTQMELETYNELQCALDKGIPARHVSLNEKKLGIINDLHLLTCKKMLYVANVSESQLREQRNSVHHIETIAYNENSNLIIICGNLESEIMELPQNEQEAFLHDLGLEESGLHKLIREGYHILGLITFYTTVGPELRAWTVRQGTSAPTAAGKIHSDMEKGFIRAEIIHFNDFIKIGNILKAKELGRIRSEGKDYIMSDGDIAHFRFNV